MAMTKIYRGMQNAAEMIQANFDEVIKQITRNKQSFNKVLSMDDVASESGKTKLSSATMQFDRSGDVTTLSGHIVTKEGFGSSSYVLFQVPYGYRTRRATGNTQTPLNVKRLGTTPNTDYATYSWDNERLIFFLSQAGDYYFECSWSSAGRPFPDE